MKYQCIVADPPWPYQGGPVGNGGRGNVGGAAERIIQVGVSHHYPSMSIDQLCAMPVSSVADRSSHLYLWTTNSFMVEAHQVAKAWGFDVKTIITWGKIKKDKHLFEPSMKTGYYFRGATEHCLFCTRGNKPLKDHIALPTLFLHERVPHSVKPDSFMEMVESASDGPYLELFCRRPREGWHAWGNQVVCDIEIPS
jgi:N6-adenosine-specific RNA methylase IME4